MTFELSADQQTARDRARDVARTAVQPRAGEIDRAASIPDDLVTGVRALAPSADPLATVLVVEEIAAASGAVALSLAPPVRGAATVLGLSGLRGARAFDDSRSAQLILSAIALGLGRAAMDAAVGTLRAAAASPGSHADAPHWVVADVATELEAARLLTWKAAALQSRDEADADTAMARLLACSAAEHAIDAALRIAGAEAYQEGSALERLARDIRAIALLAGTEERRRAIAADGLLPR